MINIGDNAYNFCLPDKDDKKVCLDQFRGKWLVLYFYPKDNTPGCTKEACDFSLNITDFNNLNAVIIGVSPDSPESHKKFSKKYSLTVTLLSDPAHEVIEKYGAWGQKKFMGKEFTGVIRSTFIIDPEGKLRAKWEKVEVKKHIEEVRQKLKELQ